MHVNKGIAQATGRVLNLHYETALHGSIQLTDATIHVLRGRAAPPAGIPTIRETIAMEAANETMHACRP